MNCIMFLTVTATTASQVAIQKKENNPHNADKSKGCEEWFWQLVTEIDNARHENEHAWEDEENERSSGLECVE